MIGFANACESARKHLVKEGYKSGFTGICDLGESWLFLGRMFEKGVPDYDNTPVTVNKENGECEDFALSLLENLKRYYDAPDIEIPKEYIIND